MKSLWLGALVWSAALLAGQVSPADTVESISITGAQNYRLSKELLQEIQRLNGAPLDQDALDNLAQRIGNELGDCSVSKKVIPGEQPAHVKVVLEVSPKKEPQAREQDEVADVNVNSRYTVEDIRLVGGDKSKLSEELSQELQKVVGEKFDQAALHDLARRVRRELHARSVSQKVIRGEKPEHVVVLLEVTKQGGDERDLHLSKFAYHGKQAWSARLFGDFDIGDKTSLVLGLASDADDLPERYTGLGAGFETRKVGSDRVGLRFLYEDYQHKWNRATLLALESDPNVPGIYRTRRSFQPWITFVLARPLKISAGAIFHLIQTQFPTARTEAANAAAGSLRYQQRFEDSQGHKHEILAGYELRAANRSLDSDFVYASHRWTLGYKIAGPRQAVVTQFTAGRLNGRAPLFERFTLGNATTLRGWNKFDVAPLGGERMAHNSLEYRHAIRGGDDPPSVVAFYDVGAVWSRGGTAVARHSAGFGARWDRFFAGLGFPLRTGRAEPIFMMGLFLTEATNF